MDSIKNPSDEYNQLANYYNTHPKVGFVKKVKDLWRIRDLYLSIPKNKRNTLEKYPVWTFSLNIFITNEGNYLLDQSTTKEGKLVLDRRKVTLAEIARLFAALTARERSNMYLKDEPEYYSALVALGKRQKQRKENAVLPHKIMCR